MRIKCKEKKLEYVNEKKLTSAIFSFNKDSWEKEWVYSEHTGKEFGKFVLSHGKFWNDPENDKGELKFSI